jgi:hypothetical protein
MMNLSGQLEQFPVQVPHINGIAIQFWVGFFKITKFSSSFGSISKYRIWFQFDIG